MERHWRRGGFPRAWLPRAEADSVRWRRQFLQTVLERDLPQLGIRIPSSTLQRFWSMVAHYHGNIWNAAEPARSLGISQPTVRTYLDILTDLFFCATAATLARQSAEATGEVTEDLYS